MSKDVSHWRTDPEGNKYRIHFGAHWWVEYGKEIKKIVAEKEERNGTASTD